MKALVLEEYNTFVYKDMPEPDMGPDDVLIQVKAVGICGSDVHGMDGSTGRRQPPIIMGHEAAGVIHDIGANVSGWNKGDRVTFDSTVYCGTCHFCRKGLINLCDNRRVLGVSCDEYRQHGAFAEYVSVPQHILYRLPDGASFEQAAMVEALSIGVHAVERTPVHLNDTALVVGTGMIGLLVIQAARAAGCGKILAVDVDQGRLDLACTLSADKGIVADADAIEKIKAETSGRGADVAFEVVGITPTIRTAVDGLRKGGSLTLVGNLSPTVDLPLQAVVTRQLTLLGSCASSGEYPACLDMIARGQVNVDALTSAVAPLSEGASWFERLHKKEPGLMKVILKP
ncbi:MAG: alcohol dehydrogenase catalytic domain-containing protein [Chitinivibrionales bacterium]|nr:alcohol dehydrogenase catalytic domain-containing protein [Chitinivibrionales bacterium]MBD3396127.1 alcohol dehydrogenase catalytic domain-containing protein [Chitinivibrionales bacterium]